MDVRISKRTYTNDSARRISRVIKDFRLRKYSKEKPIYLGKTDNRIIQFAVKNKIMVSAEGMYITAEQVAHTFRNTKVRNGIVIPAQSLISFSQSYNSMDLYYDKNKKNFVYTNGSEKFVVHPNYKIRLPNKNLQGEPQRKYVVNYITASTTNGMEFNQRNYIKI